MAVVTLQLGQCGNQIGSQFFNALVNDASQHFPGVSKKINEDYYQNMSETFFDVSACQPLADNETLVARAVMVDMESKVIAQSIIDAKKSGKWKYSETQNFCQKRGSGNNWAHGFCGHGPKSETNIMNLVRKEVEKCDYFGGFLALMSLAGGTGSGVGTYVTQALRDEYPNAFIMNQVVWPYNTGEVIVQNYNAILTLAHLYQSSDALLVMSNDALQNICSQLMGISKISFRDINKVVAHKLASVFQPVLDYESGDNIRNQFGQLIEHLTPHPEYKLLTLMNIPQMSDAALEFSVFQWHGLLKHLRQMLIANAPMEEGIDWQVKVGGTNFSNKSVSNTLILRGLDIGSADISAFKEKRLFVDWIPPQSTVKIWKHPRPMSQYEKSAAVLSNCQSPVGHLNSVVGKAWSMFASRAYVHQYMKHGVTEENFIDCFAYLEQVIKNYQTL